MAETMTPEKLRAIAAAIEPLGRPYSDLCRGIRAAADARQADRARLEAAERLHDTAEEHRQRYNEYFVGGDEDAQSYWKGRRDEAGFFRDKLAALAAKEDTNG